MQSNWETLKKSQQQKTSFERHELWLALQHIREVRRDGRPIDVLSVVDDILDHLDRPVYRACNNQTPSGFLDWISTHTPGGA